MPERLAKAVFFLAALPVVARAALRLRRLERRHRLDALAARLRRVERFRFSFYASPVYLAGCLDRLGRLTGPCLKRSLLLLDLWSRCGLEPRLHLGMARAAGGRHFHAWVTADPEHLKTLTPHREIWSG